MNNSNGALSFDAYIGDSDFKKTFDSMERRVMGFTRTIQKESDTMDHTFQRLGQVAAGYLAFNELSQLPGQIVKVRGEFQQLEIAFTTMLKSKGKADQLMSEVVDLAATTPFGLKDAAAATKQLLAYGSSANEVIGELRMLGDVAAGVGAPIGDLAYLYGTLRTQGKAFTVDIRQFAGRGIPIYEELGKVLKINTDEVANFVEQGKVGFKDVQQAFRNMSGEGGTFQNLMAKQSESLTGLTSQFADAIDVMFNDLGRSQEGILSDAIKTGIGVVENYQKILDILKVLVVAYGSYKAVVIATAAIQSAAAGAGTIKLWFDLAKGIKTAADAQALFNLTTAANPMAAAVAIVASLAAVYMVYNRELTAGEKSLKLMAEARKKAEDGAASEIAKIQILQTSIKNENLSRDQRNKKLQELIALSPKHLGALNLENIATDNGTSAINSYIDALKRKIELQEIDSGLTDSIKRQNAAKRGENEIGFFDKVLIAAQNSGSQFSTKVGQGYLGGVAKETEKYNRQIVKDEEAVQEKFRERIKLLDEVDAAANKSSKGTQKVVAKDVSYYDQEIKSLKDLQEKNATNRSDYLKYQKQIDQLERARDRITGGKSVKVAEKDKPQPFGSLAYYEQVARKADEIIQKTPSDNTAVLTSHNQIKIEAEKKAEEIRKQLVIKSFDDELEEKRNKYELYQRWVENYTTGAANDQFADLLKQGDSYASYLDKKIKALEAQNATPGIGLIGPEEEQLVKLKVEYAHITGAETPLQIFQKKLDSIRDSASSLTDEISRLKEVQANLNPDDSSPAGREKRKLTQEQLNEATKERKLQLQQYLVSVVASEEKENEIRNKYRDLRAALDEKASDKKSAAYLKAMHAIDKGEQDEYNEQQGLLAVQSKEYKALTKIMEDSTRDQTKIRVDAAKKQLKIILESYGEQSDEYRQALQNLRSAEEDHKQKSIQTWGLVADAIGQVGEILQEMDGTAGEIGSALSGLSSQVGNISTVINSIGKDADGKGTMSAQGYAAAIQGVISMIGTLVSASKKRAEAEKAFALARLGYEDDYQLALTRSLGQSYKTRENIFVKDIEAQIKSGVDQYRAAQTKYQAAIDKLDEGRAKVRQKNVVDGKSVGQMAGAGAAAGAAIGTIVGGWALGAGTVIGAAIGGIVGAIGGLFAKKKKDVFGGLLEQYPELIKEGAGGWKEINVEVARALIANNQVDDKTKQMLETAIAYNEQLQEATEQIKEGLSELTGSLGDNIREALITAFRDGTDAALAFGKAVGNVIADMTSKLLYTALFKDAFDKLQKNMLESYGINGDGTIVDDLSSFFSENKGLAQQYVDGLEAINKAMEEQGFVNPFGKKGDSKDPLKGAIQGMTEETAGLLAGQFNAIRIYSADTAQSMRQMLLLQANISRNSDYQKNLIFLADVVDELKNLNKTSLRGFGL